MLGSVCIACNALTTILCLPALGYLHVCIILMHNCIPCSVSAKQAGCTGALSFHACTICTCMAIATFDPMQLPTSRLPAIKFL